MNVSDVSNGLTRSTEKDWCITCVCACRDGWILLAAGFSLAEVVDLVGHVDAPDLATCVSIYHLEFPGNLDPGRSGRQVISDPASLVDIVLGVDTDHDVSARRHVFQRPVHLQWELQCNTVILY